MDQETNGSATPVAPAEPQIPETPTPPVETPTPAPVTPAPVEGQPPVEPAPVEPERESAAVKRARALRDEAAGKAALADKIDPPITAPTPTPPAPTAPVIPAASVTESEAPDYINDDGTIDIDKQIAYVDRQIDKRTSRIIEQREQKAAQERAQQQLKAAVMSFAEGVSRDAEEISTSVDELNPKSPKYNERLDEFITDQYNQLCDGGKRIAGIPKFKDFAMKQVELLRGVATTAASQVPNSVAGQAIDGAVTPQTTGRPPEVDISKLSPAERIKLREAKLGFAKP